MRICIDYWSKRYTNVLFWTVHPVIQRNSTPDLHGAKFTLLPMGMHSLLRAWKDGLSFHSKNSGAMQTSPCVVRSERKVTLWEMQGSLECPARSQELLLFG